jgi:hypothetical protein
MNLGRMFLRTLPVLAIQALLMADLGSALSGTMTMWTNDPNAVKGSACGYANPSATALGAPWLTNYVNKKMYCAVNDKLWNGGQACGRCYKISYGGTGGTDPGRAGSAVIQVVDSGSSAEFDCFLDAHKKITGAVTGIFPITYSQVSCQTSNTTIVMQDGENAWYTKVLVAGGQRGVSSVKIAVGGKTYNMLRSVGATWYAQLAGATGGTATFTVAYEGGATKVVKNCFKDWPVPTGAQCVA